MKVDMGQSLVQIENSNLLENIRVLCVARKTSIPKVEKALGYGNGSISVWKKAKKPAPRERVQAVADYFAVPIESLYMKSGIQFNQEPTVAEDIVTFPVIGEIAAGYDRLGYEDEYDNSIEFPRSVLKGRKETEFFVLKIVGDSMYPTYQDGDYVLIFRQAVLDYQNQIAAVQYEDFSATLKMVYYSKEKEIVRLTPVNQNFPAKTLRGEELDHCKILGVPKYMVRIIND